jgi:SAM-dependent methyltransferase
MPHHHVLDVGCGLGRMAVPLTQYLNQEGGYLGFDIMPQAINWCKKEIESRFPRFRFLPYSSGNDLYNLKAQANRPFPTESQYFDFAILTSVFSHLQPEETAFFLKELHRTLKLGGVVFATFFIFTDEERPPFNPEFAFPFDYGDYCLMDKRVKGANVAYRKSWLDKAIQNSGFSVAHHLPGFWLKGKSETTFEFQDILILQK